MKKSSKKIQLKKRSISTLNAQEVKGGNPSATLGTTTSLLTMKSFALAGGDVCVTI